MPIELIPDLPDNVIGFTATGKITAEDYAATLDDAVSRVVERFGRIRILYVLGPDFEGYSGGAMWEDGKMGMDHVTKWERIALVSDHDAMRHSVEVFGYLIPGKVKTFRLAQEAEARAWVSA